jgi:hypothetical protein
VKTLAYVVAGLSSAVERYILNQVTNEEKEGIDQELYQQLINPKSRGLL